MYFLRHIRGLPDPYTSQDHHRVVLLFFCIHGLALLGEIDRVDKKSIIDRVYSLQVHPDSRDKAINASDCGFRGSPWMGNAFHNGPKEYESSTYDCAHIASTYASLAILRTLGDNFSRVNKQSLLMSLRNLQNPVTGGLATELYIHNILLSLRRMA
jgi:geranylgeranyl transferase type-1 subunit beta